MKVRIVIEMTDDPHQATPFNEHQIGACLKHALINLPLRLNFKILSIREATK